MSYLLEWINKEYFINKEEMDIYIKQNLLENYCISVSLKNKKYEVDFYELINHDSKNENSIMIKSLYGEQANYFKNDIEISKFISMLEEKNKYLYYEVIYIQSTNRYYLEWEVFEEDSAV